MKKTAINLALALAFGSVVMSAQAATLNTGDTLTIVTGPTDTSGNALATTTSWFGMDNNGNSVIATSEKVALSQGTNGIVIGATTVAGAYHGGAPAAGETGAIVDSWGYFGQTGSNYNTIAITGGTAGLDMSGWKVAWSGQASIPMGTGAWGASYTNGTGNFTWDGVYGHSYILEYHATVPVGDLSGFGGVQYAVHFEGTVVQAVPVPATAWIVGSGLLGLIGVGSVRRKRQLAA